VGAKRAEGETSNALRVRVNGAPTIDFDSSKDDSATDVSTERLRITVRSEQCLLLRLWEET